MEFLQDYFRTYTLAVPFIALFAAIVVKWIVHATRGKFSISNALGSGGMPSAHSTLIVSLSTAIGIKYGVWSDEFMLCLAFGIIVIYDALNLRYQAGLHAKALNKLTPNTGTHLNESIGHTPIEAIVGGMIGFLTAIVLLGI